jgi:hypothetical protein
VWEKPTEGWCQFLKERLGVPVNMINVSGIEADSPDRMVCVLPPYGIVRLGISAWLSDMPTGFSGAFVELRRANQLRHIWPYVRME